MSSEAPVRRARAGRTVLAWLTVLSAVGALAQSAAPRFRPDDPLLVDDDRGHDAGRFSSIELSETYDLVTNQFGRPGDRQPRHAVNVNTLDEVPDSSWFVNRIGQRAMSGAELRRGAHKFETAEALTWDTWTVTQGKGPGGFHPGFRAERPGDPGQVYQLEIDPLGRPRLATGAEIIGTLIYHAIGYHTQDVYPVRIHPSKLTIGPRAMVRDAAGRRRYTATDLDGVLRNAARDAEGRVYFSATRFEEGEDAGNFEYFGTRADDANDIYSHEHRRELRANRVFAAWLAHDDSRALNTRNVKKPLDGHRYVEHFMYDFGAVLGSATRFPDNPIGNHQHFLEGKASLAALLTLGLRPPPSLRVAVPHDLPPAAGGYESESFEPVEWKANYPNAAFANMQPDDAFWGARIVSRFSDESLAAIVDAADLDDAAASRYLVGALGRRRDKIARAWLTPVNPVSEVTLAADGALTFVNAAVNARAATPARYEIAWARYDNATGVRTEVATTRSDEPRAAAPADLLATAAFIQVSIRSLHPDFPAWTTPVQVWFRRDGVTWTTVGIERTPPAATR